VALIIAFVLCLLAEAFLVSGAIACYLRSEYLGTLAFATIGTMNLYNVINLGEMVFDRN
jgi:hypothetical protein